MIPNVVDVHGAKQFWGNAFFLQQTLVKTFGSDGPLWSLANEFWYYMLFPCMLIAMRPGTKWRSRVVHGLVLLLMVGLLSHPIVALFPVWLAGTALTCVKLPEVPPASATDNDGGINTGVLLSGQSAL